VCFALCLTAICPVQSHLWAAGVDAGVGGDLDGNGRVDVFDLIALLRLL
jgi:hypothetical protein